MPDDFLNPMANDPAYSERVREEIEKASCKMTPWRTIEAALVAEFRLIQRCDIDQITFSGDTIATCGFEGDCEINLTTLAKSIADRINSEGK